MSDRLDGPRSEYRMLAASTMDNPAMQARSSDARLVWVALRLKAGPSGIVHHAGLEAALAEWTGLSSAAIDFALQQLGDGAEPGVRRERGLVWVLGVLDSEASFNQKNANHRLALRRHLAGLPPLPLVRAFARAHPTWFPAGECTAAELAWFGDSPPTTPTAQADGATDGMPDGMGDGIPDGIRDGIGDTMGDQERGERREERGERSNHLEPSTSDGSRASTAAERSNDRLGEAGSSHPRAAHVYSPEFDALWAAYPSRGEHGNPKWDAYKSYRARLHEGVTHDAMAAGVARYAAYCEAHGNSGTNFVMQGGRFFGKARPFDEPWGTATAGAEPARGSAIAGRIDGAPSRVERVAAFVRAHRLQTNDGTWKTRFETALSAIPDERERAEMQSAVKAAKPWECDNDRWLARHIAERLVSAAA